MLYQLSYVRVPPTIPYVRGEAGRRGTEYTPLVTRFNR